MKHRMIKRILRLFGLAAAALFASGAVLSALPAAIAEEEPLTVRVGYYENEVF